MAIDGIVELERREGALEVMIFMLVAEAKP
jgi:hypothetical protein